jgi:hypothetical protein
MFKYQSYDCITKFGQTVRQILSDDLVKKNASAKMILRR